MKEHSIYQCFMRLRILWKVMSVCKNAIIVLELRSVACERGTIFERSTRLIPSGNSIPLDVQELEAEVARLHEQQQAQYNVNTAHLPEKVREKVASDYEAN